MIINEEVMMNHGIEILKVRDFLLRIVEVLGFGIENPKFEVLCFVFLHVG